MFGQKKMLFISKSCNLCDMAEADDVNHMIMQCPCLQSERDELFDTQNEIRGGSGLTFHRILILIRERDQISHFYFI